MAMANVALGGCVIGAIATRFVYPSVSLEGRAYSILRQAPLSAKQFLRTKFFIWVWPIAVLSSVLLLSGALAVQSSIHSILFTIAIACCLSIGIVGLGIGVGAIYVRFDWDVPEQVTASFGSLVYMFLTLTVITVTMVPAALAFVFTSVPSIAANLSGLQYLFILCFSLSLILFCNIFVARWAINSGAQTLSKLEA